MVGKHPRDNPDLTGFGVYHRDVYAFMRFIY